MIHELLIAPTARGLLPGRAGHGVVAATAEMPTPLLDRLQELTASQFLPAHQDAQRVVQLHWLLLAGGKPYHVLGCVRPAGLDAHGRHSCLAHYLVLEPTELPPAGPAWLLSQPDLVRAQWDGQVRLLPGRRWLPADTVAPGPCTTWRNLTGDAGWAGILAQAGARLPGTPSWLIYEPGQPVLPLFAEALALMPAPQRWQVTFSTCFTPLPDGVECIWRGVPRGTVEARTARRMLGATVLDLAALIGRAEDGSLVSLARSLTPAAGPAITASIPPAGPTTSLSRNSLRQRIRRLAAREALLPFLVGCFVCGAVMAVVLLILSWIHYGRATTRLTSIEALDTQLVDKEDELRHLAAELHRHKDGIGKASVDLDRLRADIADKRKDSDQLATQLDSQREEATRLKRELAEWKRQELTAGKLEREYREKRTVVHDANRLLLLYAAIDKLDFGSGLHVALDCMFHGKPQDFEAAFLHWYKEQALTESAAQQLAARLDFHAQAAAEKEYLAAKAALEKYRNAPGLTNVAVVHRLRDRMQSAQARAESKTRLLLEACDTLVQKYPRTLAARELTQRPEAEAFCRKYAGLRAPFPVDGKDQQRAGRALQWLKAHKQSSPQPVRE